MTYNKKCSICYLDNGFNIILKSILIFLMHNFQKIGYANLMMENFDLKKDFEKALREHEFKVFLQPKFDGQTETLVGAEALVRRIIGPKILSPDSFIPLYEKEGLITRLDLYLLEEVCKNLQKWKYNGFSIPISVNESAKHLSNEYHGQELLQLLNKYGIEPSSIELEVTESAVIENIEIAQKAHKRMHELGFITAMDDFGVGYSSFSMLKSIPIDVLKIDKSFLDGLLEHRRFQIILESIVDMAHKLRMTTVMEGVESRQELEYLKEIGIDVFQGYYFSKPIPIEEFERRYLYI